MRRYCLAPILLVLLIVISGQAVARTSSLSNAGEDAALCPDVVVVADDAVGAPGKSAASKRNTAPAASKSRPAVRGNDNTPGRAPRWHRFLPGMFR